MNFLKNYVLPVLLPILPEIVLGLFTVYELFVTMLLCLFAARAKLPWGFWGGAAAVIIAAAFTIIPRLKRFQPTLVVPIYHRLKLVRINTAMFGALRVVLLMMLYELLCMIMERSFAPAYRLLMGFAAMYLIVRFSRFHMNRLTDKKKHIDSLPLN